MTLVIDELAVQFSAAGVTQLLEAQRSVITRNNAIESSVSDVGKKSATAARAIAGNVAAIAAVGETTSGALKGIITQGANVAFMFGTGGAIAGAIGVTALAIYNLFTNTRRQIEETARKAGEELRQLAQSANLGGIGGRYGVATQLFSGDRFAVRQEGEGDRAFEARRIGIMGVRLEMEKLNQVIEQNRPREGEMFGGQRASDWRVATDELKKWRTELEKLEPRYKALIALQDELAAEAVDAFERPRRIVELQQSLYTEANRAMIDRATDAAIPGISQLRDTGRLDRMWAGMVETMREGLKKIPPLNPIELTDELREILRIDQVAANIGQTFGSAIVDGITQGLTAGFSGGLGDGFRALTGSVLVGLGNMAIQIGTQSAAFLAFMKTIQDAIAAFLPGVGLVAAFGMIGLGAAMIALGSSLGGRGRGFGGGASGGYGYPGYGGGSGQHYVGVLNPPYTSAPSTSGLTPVRPVTVNATIIGTRDPRAGRELLDLIQWAQGRGNL